MEISSLKRDTSRVEAGEWINDIPGMGDLELKVRGTGNRDFRIMQSKLLNAIPAKRRRSGVLDPEDIDRISAKCLLETVLLDWRGLRENGNPVPYSRDVAEALLCNSQEFRDAVNYAAGLVGSEQAEADRELEKNSHQSSTGG